MKRILLSKLRAMGDTVMLSATLEETRRLFPKDEVHLLIPEMWKDLYAHDSRITRLWTFDMRLKGWKRVKAFFKLASDLRFYDFDISLACHANPTSSWLGFLSGAQIRAHHNHNFLEADRFGNVEIPDKKVLKPFIERDLAVLRALEKEVNLKVASRLMFSEDIRRWAALEFDKLSLRGPVLGLGLGASRSTKIWPMEKFAEVSREWHARTGGSVLSLVSPAEKALAEEWKNGAGFKVGSDISSAGGALAATKVESHQDSEQSPYVFAAHYSVEQVMGLLSHCRLFLGNDSGPRHLAAALGLKTVTLYGPQDPYECHPYDRSQHPYFYIENLKCRTNSDLQGKHPWCGIAECVVEKHKCMKDLPAGPVVQKCLELS